MRSICTAPMRFVVVSVALMAASFAFPSGASAQGFGVGGRIAWVKADSDVDVDSVRFNGGQIRLVSKRWGLEVSLDRNSEEFEAINQKVTATPIQTSLLLRLAGGSVAPYLLGGPGWYKRHVEPIDGPDDLDLDTTEFGWHAGGGLEILAGRHFGIHGDYRYTFLDFGEDDDEEEGFVGGLIPGHRGSMWTIGATIYF
ncbi:MAG TPA: porin family protein [Vicinamibacterales bacterium]|nr:porin family protein [Vicinamibacterales bacterium]